MPGGNRYHEEYARIFGRAVRFEQPFTGIAFDRALLDVPSPHKDDAVHEAIRALAERRMSAGSTAFHRAFKRWTGTTPGTYRQSR